MTDSNGGGISLLILSAPRPLVPLNVTGAALCLKAAGFHLSCPPPFLSHLARFAPRQRLPQSGHIWRRPQWQARYSAQWQRECIRRERHNSFKSFSYSFSAARISFVSGLEFVRGYNKLISSLVQKIKASVQ